MTEGQESIDGTTTVPAEHPAPVETPVAQSPAPEPTKVQNAEAAQRRIEQKKNAEEAERLRSENEALTKRLAALESEVRNGEELKVGLHKVKQLVAHGLPLEADQFITGSTKEEVDASIKAFIDLRPKLAPVTSTAPAPQAVEEPARPAAQSDVRPVTPSTPPVTNPDSLEPREAAEFWKQQILSNNG